MLRGAAVAHPGDPLPSLQLLDWCSSSVALRPACCGWARVRGLLFAFVLYCWSFHLYVVQKWLPHYRPRTSDLILNTEAANFNHSCLPRLPEDCQLDADSSCPEEAIFEKMTAGLYLGDIVRRILIRCDCCVLLRTFSTALTVVGTLTARHTVKSAFHPAVVGL